MKKSVFIILLFLMGISFPMTLVLTDGTTKKGAYVDSDQNAIYIETPEGVTDISLSRIKEKYYTKSEFKEMQLKLGKPLSAVPQAPMTTNPNHHPQIVSSVPTKDSRSGFSIFSDFDPSRTEDFIGAVEIYSSRNVLLLSASGLVITLNEASVFGFGAEYETPLGNNFFGSIGGVYQVPRSMSISGVTGTNFQMWAHQLYSKLKYDMDGLYIAAAYGLNFYDGNDAFKSGTIKFKPGTTFSLLLGILFDDFDFRVGYRSASTKIEEYSSVSSYDLSYAKVNASIDSSTFFFETGYRF